MLPTRPSFTIHAFKNVFPRPSLRDILSGFCSVSKPLHDAVFPAVQTCIYEASSEVESPQLSYVPSHMANELVRTGLLMRRFYFMTYVPSGFWPRLISRFLTASRFANVILKSLGFPDEQIYEITSQLVSGEVSDAVSLEWAYWKTGIELWYKGLSLLRVTEIIPEGSFANCAPCPSMFEQSQTCPIEPAADADDLSFELDGMWMPVDMTPNRGIEVIVADVVCCELLQKEVSISEAIPSINLCNTEIPLVESQWMSAQILSMTVDYIDTLLEDWYPGLGAREGNKTVESIPYVNRVIPCPYCVSGACPYDQQLNKVGMNSGLDQDQDAAATRLILETEASDAENASALNPNSKVCDKTPNSKAKRVLFPSSSDSKAEHKAKVLPESSRHDSKSSVESFRRRSLSSPTNEKPSLPLPKRQGSLAEFYRGQKKISPTSGW